MALAIFSGIVVHQDHVGGLDGGVGAHGAHGDADVRPAEDRGVVDAVPHEGQLFPLRLVLQQLLHLFHLVRRGAARL